MTILAQTPQQVQLNSPATGSLAPSADLSLEELRKLRAQWIRQAEESGDIGALTLIVKTLGRLTSVNGWKCYAVNRGEITACLYEGSGAYLPARKEYARIQTLNVRVGDRQVCYYRTAEDGRNADALFVPGKWVSSLLAELEMARAVYASRLRTVEDEERAILIEQLLIGQEV